MFCMLDNPFLALKLENLWAPRKRQQKCPCSHSNLPAVKTKPPKTRSRVFSKSTKLPKPKLPKPESTRSSLSLGPLACFGKIRDRNLGLCVVRLVLCVVYLDLHPAVVKYLAFCQLKSHVDSTSVTWHKRIQISGNVLFGGHLTDGVIGV